MLNLHPTSQRKPGPPKFSLRDDHGPGDTYSMGPGFRRDEGLWELEIAR